MLIRRPDDFHVHFRRDSRTAGYIWQHAEQFQRALVMPNLAPKPILTAEDAIRYQNYLKNLISGAVRNDTFVFLMTIQITDETTPEMIQDAATAGIIAGKLYPAGVTTNSANGVTNLEKLLPVFEMMAGAGMRLCVHAEDPDTECLSREHSYLSRIKALAKVLPRLKITIEHASTAKALELVYELPNVAASITAHHLELTLDDVIGNGLRPHNYCKPIAKFVQDRAALRAAATSGSPKFFLGSDSAPHTKDKKECACGAAGVYTAPLLLPLLATRFEQQGALDKLEAFTSEHGARWYGLELNEGTVELEKYPWRVPQEEDGVVPFMANEVLDWRMA